MGPRPRRKLGKRLGKRQKAHLASRETSKSQQAKITGEKIEG